MRAGPLSNTKVIELLNGYFVPVYAVNEDYATKGSAPLEEKAERDRIFQEGHALKLSVGSVHVYVLRPDGRLLDSMHVATAARTTNLIAMLQRAIEAVGARRGPPAVEPVCQTAAPVCAEDTLRLHLVARSLDGKGAWSEFPVENWIVLTSAEQRSFWPGKAHSVGDSWVIDNGIAEKILAHFYPATENNDISKNKFIEQRLAATVLESAAGGTRVRLDGRLKMQHSFYHKDDGKIVEADITGFADFEERSQRITSLRLVTQKATYNGGQFAVAVRSIP
jgi:hypothetical protein